MARFLLAKQGVFHTIQGEGALLGLPMVFIRLAGCSVGCPECDTDYAADRRVELSELLSEVSRHLYGATRWVWITGGEPTDQDLPELMRGLHTLPCKVAVATSGIREVGRGFCRDGADFLSVSPHDPATWVQRTCDQVNFVAGLNGRRLTDYDDILSHYEREISHKYVTPCDGKPETMRECLQWVRCHSGWKLGIQAHKVWGLP